MILLVYLVLTAQVANSNGVRKYQAHENEEQTRDYTNHVVAFERNCIGFEKLEEFLQDNVKSEDIEANMVAARGLLNQERNRPTGEIDAELLRALEMFASLDRLLDVTTCGRDGYNFLIGLKTATKYHIDRRTTKRRRFHVPLRRIELLMSRFAIEHAYRCKSVFPSKFDQLYSTLERTKIDQIDAFMDEVIRDRLGGQSIVALGNDAATGARLRKIYLSFINQNESFKKVEDAEIISNFVTRMSNINLETVDDGEKVNESVRSWFLDHVMKPCDYYAQTMATDIFVPAHLDSNVLDNADKYKPVFNESRNGFIFGWARFGLCKMLQRDKNILMKKVTSQRQTSELEEI